MQRIPHDNWLVYEQEARALYESALAKLEATLEGEPANATALRLAGLVMLDLAQLHPGPGPRAARELLRVSHLMRSPTPCCRHSTAFS